MYTSLSYDHICNPLAVPPVLLFNNTPS